MDKSAIKEYAVWARNELITQVKQRAYLYGIDEKNHSDTNAVSVNSTALTPNEIKQRQEFISLIDKRGFQRAVEEVAYTWFNRFAALRFMEVNDYLPTHVRVFSDSAGAFNPEILKDVLHLDLDGLDKAKAAQLLHENKTDELYRYLLLTQCNALNAALPEIFEKLGSYTEMLLPGNILKPDGVIGRLVTDIPEEDWRDAVQIIGWLYQYYNTEPKQAVFDGLKKNVKITKEKIPAATQLFTPDWIVRYMVENSLGRLWVEGHPNPALKAQWKYYLDEAEQTPEVTAKLEAIRQEYKNINPEDIRLIDPCMGSGHILVYAFDVLMQIYHSAGYAERDAAKLILEKNLYGLDIDPRAYQLAYFALMMKARQYNRRIFTEDVRPQVYHPAGWSDGEEFGSLLKVDDPGKKPEPRKGQISTDDNHERDLRVWNYKRLLSQKYDVVVTNPPYMGGSGMNGKLSTFVKREYADSKSDLFAAFIKRGLALVRQNGFSCMVTMQSWMFLSSFETMRKKILQTRTITNLLHMENMVMGIAFGTAVSNLRGIHVGGYKGRYNHITIADIVNEKPAKFPTGGERDTATDSANFTKIPGSPVAYWVSARMLQAFDNEPLEYSADAKQGLITGDNDRFLRLWYEVEFRTLDVKWFKYNKGGEFRKWYGNRLLVVNWENDGFEIKNNKNECRQLLSRPQNLQYFFRESISWTSLTSGPFNARYSEQGTIFDAKGSSAFTCSYGSLITLLGFLNSCVTNVMLKIIAPTLDYNCGVIAKLPYKKPRQDLRCTVLGDTNIELCRNDWDAFETSWDFVRHPLIRGSNIFGAFAAWGQECEERFRTLKANEEELNRIFIDIYGLQDELTPEVADKDVTVRRAELGRDIRSFISYAIGCMFGRYSLDTDGLAYAGGTWDAGKYRSFIPDGDNVLPICDDEYFEDDIVCQFVRFVRTVYGADTLEENLRFIAEALGGNGSSREVIRRYFLNDFYKDHCKIYKKRPIYWLFDSGPKNSFKALIYLHRYRSDLLAKLRTDYVHEQQERYRTQLKHIAEALENAAGSERARLLKQQDKLTTQAQELAVYEEKIHHLADMNISLDLDDGVKVNYAKFADVLAKI